MPRTSKGWRTTIVKIYPGPIDSDRRRKMEKWQPELLKERRIRKPHFEPVNTSVKDAISNGVEATLVKPEKVEQDESLTSPLKRHQDYVKRIGGEKKL